MDVDVLLAAAMADADRRGLPALKPLLEPIVRATRALRAADWGDHADGQRQGPEHPSDPGRRGMDVGPRTPDTGRDGSAR